MASLAENLKPPFYAAILNEGGRPKTYDDEITPTDEMVSIAPSQPGFLGLETTSDKEGKCVTISYWSDLQAEKAWEHRGDNEIRKHFDGQALKDSCSIRVSKIDHKIGQDKALRADVREFVVENKMASVAALVLGLVPVLTSLFRHEAV